MIYLPKPVCYNNTNYKYFVTLANAQTRNSACATI